MINHDKKGNPYAETLWTRFTFISGRNRAAAKNWSGSDVIRIQAKKGKGNNALHRGAEIPLKDKKAVGDFISSIIEIYNED